MKHSAGFLVYKTTKGDVKVLLVHPAGPIWGKKDFWSIPKGVLGEDEDHLQAARREFKEETGADPPDGSLIELGSDKQDSTKTNYIWAVEGEFDTTKFKSNNFTMEWPPKSGKTQEFPECDRAAWFDLPTAKQKLFKGQAIFINRLAEHLKIELPNEPEQQTLI